MSPAAGTGSGGGISVENRTDERRVVEIGPIGGDTTERTVEPRGAFVWGETPDDRFDLEVSTDDHWAVVEVDAGTDPDGITVRLTRSGVVVDHPGDAGDLDDTPDSEHDSTRATTTHETTTRTDDGGPGSRDDETIDDPWGADSTDDSRGADATDDPWDDGAEPASERGIDLLGGESTDRTTSASESASARSNVDPRPSGGSDDDSDTGPVDASSPDGSVSSRSESAGGSESASPTTRERDHVSQSDTDDDERDHASPSGTGGDEVEHVSQSDGAGDETDASPGADANGVGETPSEPASRSDQSRGVDTADEVTTTIADPDAPTPDAAREAFERTAAIDERLDELERRAVWLDEEFRIPLTNTRVGVSSIVGLLPGAGDGLMFLVALSLVYHGLRLGASTRTLLWMSVVLTVEFAVSVVPVVGDIVGVLWSANVQNVGYLRANRESLDGSTNWVFVLLLCSPWIVTFLAVVSLL